MSFRKPLAKVRRRAARRAAMMEPLESRTLMTLTSGLTPPTNVVAEPTLNSGGVTLRWTDDAGDNDGYVINRYVDDGLSWQLQTTITIADPDQKTYTEFVTARSDGHGYDYLDPSTTYVYSVQAYAGEQVSAFEGYDQVTPDSFALYNNLGFFFRPSNDQFESQGLRTIKIMNGVDDILEQADPTAAARQAASNTVDAGATLLVLDIEDPTNFPFDARKPGGATAVQNTVTAVADVLKAIHAEWVDKGRPDLRVGVYGGLPIRDYYNSLPSYQGTTSQAAWQAADDALVSLVQNPSDPTATVDVLVPSLYAFYANQPAWEDYARGNLLEAQDAYEPGGRNDPNGTNNWTHKPILPYLWMNYHTGEGPVEQEYWQRQLSAVRELADEPGSDVEGLVAWSDNAYAWDESAAWWQATTDFIQDTHTIQSPGYSLVATVTSSTQLTLSWRAVPGATDYVVEQFVNGQWTTLTNLSWTQQQDDPTCSAVLAYNVDTLAVFHVWAVGAGGVTSRTSRVAAALGASSPGTYNTLTLRRGVGSEVDDLIISSTGNGQLAAIDLSLIDRLSIRTFGAVGTFDTLLVDYGGGDAGHRDPTPTGGVFFVGGAGTNAVNVYGSPDADQLLATAEPSGGPGVMMVLPGGVTGVGHPISYDRAYRVTYNQGYSGSGGDVIKVLDGTIVLPGGLGFGSIEVDGGTLKIEGRTAVTGSVTVGARYRNSDGTYRYVGNGTLLVEDEFGQGSNYYDFQDLYVVVYSGVLVFDDSSALLDIPYQSILVDARGTVAGSGLVTAAQVLAKIDPASIQTLGSTGTGSLGIIGTNSEALDFSNYPTLGLAAIGEATYTGVLTPYNGATYSLGGPSGGGWGTGTLTFTPLLDNACDLEVNGNVTLNRSQGVLSLSINAGKLLLIAGGGKVLRMTSLNIGGAAQLDLADNDMILDYYGGTTSPADLIRQYLFIGRNGGDWKGLGGIVTSTGAGNTLLTTAIGWCENSLLGLTTFDGQAVDSTALILKYTYYGDADLDGAVDGDDFNLLDQGAADGGSVWGYGDFNYDAQVDNVDYALFGNANTNQGDPL